MQTAVKMQGIVNSYVEPNGERKGGYGFIRRDDGERDAFYHISAVLGKNPKIGQRVEFELTEDNGRPRAINVQGT